ncbi:unnamed protein product [Sphagnum jensenii]|uniref:Uncharacterized protein n=1 Tax=Sphagnum jensenii TaxID=128206 RepID=A0ABP0VC48_9BRYO
MIGMPDALFAWVMTSWSCEDHVTEYGNHYRTQWVCYHSQSKKGEYQGRYFYTEVTIALTGCASGPSRPDHLDNRKVIGSDYGTTWNKALQTLATEGYPILTSNKEAGIISTGKKAERINTDDADCGTFMGLPYIKDDRTVVSVSYSVLIKDVGGKADVTVNTDIAGTYQGGDTTKQLNCFSQGGLEKQFLEKL